MARIKKAELVAKLQKIEDLAKFLSLHLKLDDSTQADVEVIKTKLQEAFSNEPFSDFGQGNKLMCLPMK